MTVHCKSNDNNIAMCGASGMRCIIVDDVDKVDCKQCLHIINFENKEVSERIDRIEKKQKNYDKKRGWS